MQHGVKERIITVEITWLVYGLHIDSPKTDTVWGGPETDTVWDRPETDTVWP